MALRTPGGKTAIVDFAELYTQDNQEKIVLLAKQKGGFRKQLDSELQRVVVKRTRKVARDTLQQGIAGIKEVLKKGIPGARSRVSKAELRDSSSKFNTEQQSVDVTIRFNGLTLGEVEYTTRFNQLSPTTIWRKQSHPGSGSFWQDYGSRGTDNRGRKTISALADDLEVPSVSVKIEELDLNSRRENKKDAFRIDFTVSVGFGQMSLPFNDLVRRPLITGDENSGKASSSGSSNDKENVLFHLEYGFEGRAGSEVPARPWIRAVSGQVGNNLFYNILNQ